MTSLTNPSAPATSPSSFVNRLTELTTLPVRQRKLRKSLPVGMGADVLDDHPLPEIARRDSHGARGCAEEQLMTATELKVPSPIL